MKILHISKEAPSKISFSLAINGKLIGIKKQAHLENKYINQFIEQYKKRGVNVICKQDGFIIDIFPQNYDFFKLGDIEIDFKKDTFDDIENKLCEFYTNAYLKENFKVVVE